MSMQRLWLGPLLDLLMWLEKRVPAWRRKVLDRWIDQLRKEDMP